MDISLPPLTIRLLKGAPVSCWVALQSAREPVQAAWLCHVTGYGAHAVTDALRLLEEAGLAVHDSHRSSWQLVQPASSGDEGFTSPSDGASSDDPSPELGETAPQDLPRIALRDSDPSGDPPLSGGAGVSQGPAEIADRDHPVSPRQPPPLAGAAAPQGTAEIADRDHLFISAPLLPAGAAPDRDASRPGWLAVQKKLPGVFKLNTVVVEIYFNLKKKKKISSTTVLDLKTLTPSGMAKILSKAACNPRSPPFLRQE